MNKERGLLYRSWLAPGAEAILLLVHGLGAHSGRWEFLAKYFLQKSISSYALELKGFGETEGERGHVDSFRIYIEDVELLREIIEREHPGKNVFILGESMGALISILASGEKNSSYTGLICMSPAFSSTMKVSLARYMDIVFSLIFDPKKQFDMPFTSAMCTRDEAYRKVMEDDPRECRVASAKLIFGILTAQLQSISRVRRSEKPVLFLLADEDKLVDKRMSEKVFSSIRGKDKTIIRYPGMYHALSIDTGRDKVFADTLGWIRGHQKK